MSVMLLLMHRGVMAGDGASDQARAKGVSRSRGSWETQTCRGTHVRVATHRPRLPPWLLVVSGQRRGDILGSHTRSAPEITSRGLPQCGNMPREMLPAVS